MKLQAASNRQQTLLRKLNRKKYRYEKRLFLIEGARAVQQIIENGALGIKALFFDQAQEYWLQSPWRDISEKVDSYTLGRDIFMEVSDTDNPQGVLAMCHMPKEKEVAGLASESGIIVAFDRVQDPGNLGTIIRTASWFGVAAVISGKGTVDLFHPKVVRSTAGATGAMPYTSGDLSEILVDFEAKGWFVNLLDAGENSEPLGSSDVHDKTILVVGNEAHGVSPELFSVGRKKLRISSPSGKPKVESLNAAIATSIALYDLSNKRK